METPNIIEYDSGISGCTSGSFSRSSFLSRRSSNSRSFFESTPNQITPILDTSRKRKYESEGLKTRRLEDVIESVSSPPQFSSTLNDSLINNFENCQIKPSVFSQENDQSYEKYFKVANRKIVKCSHPTTPNKLNSYSEIKKPLLNSYFSPKIIDSPQKEANEILYAHIRNSATKIYSPQKFSICGKLLSPAKKCLFEDLECQKTFNLFQKVVSSPVIMAVIFSNLSNGDIYRASLAHPMFKRAIAQNAKVRLEHQIFLEKHKRNKENYQITPPGSPEKSNSPPSSPNSKNFKDFIQIAQLLNSEQSLTKCPKCNKPSVVENKVAQCQSIMCGYIICQKCLSSSSTGPNDFYDKCQSSALGKKPRPFLGDLSNNPSQDTDKIRKRFPSFDSSPNSGRKTKKDYKKLLQSQKPKLRAFSEFNKNAIKKAISPPKRRMSTGVVPVIPLQNVNYVQDFEPMSPETKIIVGSQRSKQNLKRLTK